LLPRPGHPVPFGKYLLLERIASGGMAEVFRAVLRGAAGFEKVVALKRILPAFGEEPGFVTLFQDEARIASTLTHANIAQVFELGEVDGTFYLALELVDGLDLGKLVKRLAAARQPMPLACAVFIVAEAARGLAHAHETRGPDGQLVGIVHRDVSPPNLLLSRAGDVKVADFGIAKAAGKVHKTETGVVMGKLRYMSPEQVAGDVELDARSDIFSLGVILYELCAGGPLFPDAPPVRAAELVRTADILPPSTRNPEVPAALDAIVLRALARRREDRYPRAADLARDLSVFLAGYAPGFTREDLGVMVTRLAQREEPDAGVAPTAPARARLTAPRTRRRVSGAAWLGAVLLLVIAASGLLVAVRFFLPARDEAVPDARALVLTPAPLDAAAPPEPPPSAPFTLLPSATPEERAALAGAVDDHLVTRRGTPAADYAAFLTGLDCALAALVVDGEGRGVPPPPPPPPVAAAMAGTGVEAAVAATVEHVRRTGELPPLVRDAARSFLAGQPSVAADAITMRGARMPAFSAAALALWLGPRSKGRLVELAHANDVLGRWCDPPAPPARHFAPLLCERAALVAALRAVDRGDPTAAALERWERAADELDGVAVDTIGYEPAVRPDQLTLRLTLAVDAPGATLLAGGLPEATLVPAGDARSFAATVPARLVAPVLRVDGVEGFLKLPAPPWGSR
jgi:hypothetical protein